MQRRHPDVFESGHGHILTLMFSAFLRLWPWRSCGLPGTFLFCRPPDNEMTLELSDIGIIQESALKKFDELVAKAGPASQEEIDHETERVDFMLSRR